MRAVDLFAGAGGFSLGLRQAGIETTVAYDFWPPAIAVHEANLGHRLNKLTGRRNARLANLGSFDPEAVELEDLLKIAPYIASLNPDLIVGGPPCQPWSSANKSKNNPRGEADPRAKLTDAYAIIVALARPRFFVMENVPALRRFNIFSRIKETLRRVGYGLTETVVDASYYGVGQARRRLLLIGCLGEDDGWLVDHIEAAKSARWTTVADVLGPDFGKVFFRRGHNEGERRSLWLTSEPAPTITSTMRRGAGEEGYSLRTADVRTIERMPPEEQVEVARLFWLTPGGQSSAGTRRVDRPAPTFLHQALDKPCPGYVPKVGDVLDPSVLPIPTFEQVSRLGGFPEEWDWSAVKSRTHRMQMLANAVPPPLAKVVGECLLSYAAGEIPERSFKLPKQYGKWLRRWQKLPPDRASQIVSDTKAAFRMLGQRELRDLDHAIERLKQVPAFAASKPSRRSNLVKGLKLWLACQDDVAERARQSRIVRFGADIDSAELKQPKRELYDSRMAGIGEAAE